MQIPEEFKAFASLFDLQLHDRTPNERELIAFAIKHTPPEHKSVVRGFLDQMLNPSIGGAELQKIWLDSGASVLISDEGELRYCLNLARGEIG